MTTADIFLICRGTQLDSLQQKNVLIMVSKQD